MSESGYKIDQFLLNALKNIRHVSFSAGQLEEAFCHELGVCNVQKNKGLQNWIYRQLTRLVKYGLLKRQKAKNPRMVTYQSLLDFSDINFDICNGPFSKAKVKIASELDSVDAMSLPDSPSKPPIGDLKKRAKQCHVDLLSSVGESEEYKVLFKIYPSLRDALQPRYQEALETSSKLLGQLRAIEAALEHYQVHAL